VNLKKAILLRSWIAFLMVILLACAVIWQIVNLQFTQKGKYTAISLAQSTKWREIQASRGNIYAEDGSLLATSIPKYELRLDTKVETITNEYFNANVDILANNLALKFTDRTNLEWRNYLLAARNKGERYLLIKRDVDYMTVKDLAEWPIFKVDKDKIGGLIKIEKFKREIPFGYLAMRSIGYTNQSGIKIGLEGSYDSMLSGTVGKRLEQRIYGGVWKPVDNSSEMEPRNGFDVYTTIDINIQDVAENALQQCLLANQASHGCAILMEVKTGAVKAIANLKRNADNTCSEAENYAVNEFSDPGSTFKLVSALALLESKSIKLEDTIDIEWGATTFGDLKMVDSHRSPYKKINFQYAFENSSNVGIAKSVQKYFKNRPEAFLQYAFNLGLNKPLTFDIKSTRKPLLKNTKDKTWSSTTSLPFMSIGYEMELSALQILSVYNTIANNGTMVKPFIVREVKEFGKIIQKNETSILNEKICSEETIKLLKKLLEGVVENGTGNRLKGLAYKVAGKTGTAQKASSNGYDKSAHKASFVGYFPADNPKYSCIVVINDPTAGDYYGGTVAGPVFREIADKVFSTNISLHKPIVRLAAPSMPKVKNGNRSDIKYVLNHIGISSHQIIGSAESEYVRSSPSVQSLNLKEITTDVNLIPDVVGMGLKDAVYLLENRGVKVIVEGYGSICFQSIPAGTRTSKGNIIYLRLNP